MIPNRVSPTKKPAKGLNFKWSRNAPHCPLNRNNRFLIRKLLSEGLTWVLSEKRMDQNNFTWNILLKKDSEKTQLKSFQVRTSKSKECLLSSTFHYRDPPSQLPKLAVGPNLTTTRAKILGKITFRQPKLVLFSDQKSIFSLLTISDLNQWWTREDAWTFLSNLT